ncbi:MAG TPA: MmcQ/YjbR family DNA-binding protein [Solirubrobacteraceae bacterium]|nr:MmcQ/YjbR family DNA-binding protein [Solirubrobacteraceae bacterium]
MADLKDVRRIALGLPETSERPQWGNASWRVRNKPFVWERPLRPADLRALGDAAPDGPILGVRVEHVGAKEAMIADDPSVYFTTPHFDGYAAVLVRLDEIALDELKEVVAEAWLCQAPKRLANEFLESRGLPESDSPTAPDSSERKRSR